jgi:hypothetical protein
MLGSCKRERVFSDLKLLRRNEALTRAESRLMAIDNPIDAFKKQHPEEGEKTAQALALSTAKLALPGFVGEILNTVFDRLGGKAQNARAKETLELLFSELQYLQDAKAAKVELNDLRESIQLLIRHDVEEFNDKKRDRYLKIIGNALGSETRIEDLASFIQDVEQLGERDFIALKVVNKVMNKPGDWGSPAAGKLHPNTFIHRRQELAVQLAQAFGVKTDLGYTGQTFSHEEGYEACTRLQGFGLAHDIDVGAREVPGGDYCFRPSKRGLLLLKLTGEQVPNWDKYFPNSS